MLLFIGTQCADEAGGVFSARLDPATGRLTGLGLAAVVERPTWVLADSPRRLLYAVSEVGNAGDREAEALSFWVGATGELDLLSRAPSGGGGATHLALDPAGRRLFVANFGGGQIASLPIDPAGRLLDPLSVQTTFGSGPHRRQTGPHAHGVTLDPSGQYLLAPDMGADRVFLYRYDAATGALSPGEPAYAPLPAGSGPRLLLFGADGRFAYLLTELSAEIFVFAWDAPAGRLQPRGSVALDGGEVPADRSAAGFAMTRDGRFLYASNRRTSTLHVHAIDAATGGLTEVQSLAAGGDRPWGLELTPDDRWLVTANQASNGLRTFGVDTANGRLTPVDGGLEVPTPTGLAFMEEAP